jgi:hypothetical protein
MLNINYIPDQVLTDILRNRNLDESDKSYEVVGNMSVHEAFDAFLTYNGFIGYTSILMQALDGIREAERMHNEQS